jgi:hypothetical protein
MHQGYNDLETMIEDELLDYNNEHEPMPHDIYGIEFDERYLLDHGLFELEDAIEKIQDSAVESDIIKPEITELTPDLEIIRIVPTNHLKILRYFNPK